MSVSGDKFPRETEWVLPTVVQTLSSPTIAPTYVGIQTPVFTVDLPAGYISGAATMAPCQSLSDPLWEKLAVSAPSLLVSIVAIFLSFKAFGYSRRKDQRSRSQSIQDDYWIRKIISPISIEPFLKYTIELSASLPMFTSAIDSNVEVYWTQHALKLSEFSLSFRTLILMDTQLDTDVGKKLETFEDCLAIYCGKLRLSLADTSAPQPDRAECARKFIGITIEILKLIQRHQASVGDS